MNQYKKAIYKLAEVTPVYRANKLHDLMEGFVDYDDAGTPEMRSYFERDVRNYVEEHPLFNQYVEDEAFNEERYKTKHPHGGKALAGAVAGSAIGSAVLSNLQGAKAVLQNAGARGSALKAFVRGVDPRTALAGAAIGAGIGGIGKLIMDERHRRNIHGPMRDDTWDTIEALPGSKMKDLIRENLSAADYSKVMSDKKMADAANAAALAYKQKAIHDMINSSNKKEASDMNEGLYKEAKFEAIKKFLGRGPKNVAEGGRKILQAGKDYNVAKTPQTQGLAYAKLKKGGKALGKGVAETSAVYGGVPVGAYGAYKIFKKKDTEQDKAANEAYKDAIYKEAKIGAIVKGVGDFVKNQWRGQGMGTGTKKMLEAGKDFRKAKTPQTEGLSWLKFKKGAKEFGKGAVIPGTAGLATGATIHGLRKKREEN